ncbi:hybrid sensor histidine kinase/response regulator [Noviherbaspirillum aerium]|uniref:hybrid sensor histidine kinase/response regulator n=1 Tax=Noviherbaspirillum aerium TaxID=2588497 RepID=UPI00124DF642|nr:PAS domain S-box protein [Noviherbaspirillum aerium]
MSDLHILSASDEESSLHEELEKYRFLTRIDDAIRSLVDSADITQTAATLLGQTLEVERCAYAYVNEDDDSFTLTGNYTNGVPSIVGRYESASFGSEFVRLSHLGLPYIVEDTETDERVKDVLEAYRQTQIRAVVSIPVLKAGRFRAGMAVHQSTPRRWKDHEVKLLTAVAHRCWESIERNRIALELRNAEERIRNSHDYLRLLINCTEEGFYSIDSEGATVLCNAAFLKLLGFEREEEVIGRKLHALIHHSHSDGSPYSEKDCPIYKAARDGVSAYVQDESFFRRDGSSFPVEYRVRPVWRNGRLDGAVCTFVDLTDRRHTEMALQQSEAHLQSLFEQTAVGICETDGTGQIIRVNDRYCEIVARTREELLARKMQDITHPDDLPRNLALLRKAVATGQPFELEKRYVRPDGSIVWVNNTVSLIRTPGSQPVHSILAVTLDISERKRVEDALRQADQRKDEFLAMLAHELRNPLAPIGAAGELLAIGQLDRERIMQTSAVISRQVRHMSGLLDDLLDVSRVTRGLATLDKADLDVKHVIADAIEQVRPLIEGKRHRLTVELDPEPAHVQGDAKRLVQILTNLLNNAAKYTPEQGSISLTMRAPDGQVILEVLDNGIGITPGLQPHIFDLFAQAERSPDRSQGGLGIGLALVKSLVTLHNGTITCHSAGLGKGSRFTVTLPRQGRPAIRAAQAQDGVQVRAGSSKLRILVVDDNVDAAQLLGMYLEVAGHEVAVEHDSRQALIRAGRELPDVCILDIGLPEMDGNELARRLRAQEGTAKMALIAVTGYGQEQDRLNAMAAGFNHHFVKPVDAAKLLALLSDISKARGIALEQ